MAGPNGTADEATVMAEDEDQEIVEILAFEQERVRSWKRCSNALLAALRLHHPERDPGDQPGVSQNQPRGASGKEPRGASGKDSSIASPPLQPVSNSLMRAAHDLFDGAERHAGRGNTEAIPGFAIARIKRAVCAHYAVEMNDLVAHRRQVGPTRARQVAMYIAKVKTGRSFPEIGRHFGDRDHTTVLHAVRKIERDLDAHRDDIAAICAAMR